MGKEKTGCALDYYIDKYIGQKASYYNYFNLYIYNTVI